MNKSTEGIQVERRLALVKSTVAASLNSILRQVESSDYGPTSEKRMAHNVKMCREAMKLLLTPPPPEKVTNRQKSHYIQLDELIGER